MAANPEIIIIIGGPVRPAAKQADDLADTLRDVAEKLDSGEYQIAKPTDGRK